MLATNPVDPRPISRPRDPRPRRPALPVAAEGSSPAPFPVGKFLGISALVLAGYVVLGTIGADAVAARREAWPDRSRRLPRQSTAPVATPVAGDFRLAPGNNLPQGVVVRLGVPEPFPGDFRLAPGNNHAAGPRRRRGRPDHPLHGAGRGIVPGRRLRASRRPGVAGARGRVRACRRIAAASSPATFALFTISEMFARDRRPVRDRGDPGEEPRRHGGPAHARCAPPRAAPARSPRARPLVERIGLGHRVADDEPGLEPHRLVGTDDGRRARRRPAPRPTPGSRSAASRSPGSRRSPRRRPARPASRGTRA